jgi:hypothetical protein
LFGFSAQATLDRLSAALASEQSVPSLTGNKTPSTHAGAKPSRQYDWPGVPSNKLGNPLVKIGNNFVDNAREILLSHWDEFLEVYKNRPDKVNMCGIRINHAYALWITIKHLKPQSIIESGVNAGQSTYFMRNASSTARIFPIDPEEKAICQQGERWVDKSPLTTYFTGKDFRDIQDIDWRKLIRQRQVDPNRTLVFLDDHLQVLPRFSTFLRLHFRHIMVEDNYKKGEGATPQDSRGFTMKQMFNRVDLDTDFIFHQLISYTEFPPLVPPIMDKASNRKRKPAGGFMVATDNNTDIMPPLLRPDIDEGDMKLFKEVCQKLGLDPDVMDEDSYMQLMNYNQICYMELRPLSPKLVMNWK